MNLPIPDREELPDEIERVGELANDEPEPAPPSIPTFLGVTPERFHEIVGLACDRINECRGERGDQYGNPMATAGSHTWIRQRARIEYQGNMDLRRSFYGPASIWNENNATLNVPAQFIRFLHAKHSDDLVGSDPFFACMPEKNGKPELSKQVENKVQDEVTRSNMRSVLSESIRVALTEGERPLKVTWEVDETQFVGPATVAVDADGMPLKTPSGEFIYENDDTFATTPDGNGGDRLLSEDELAQLSEMAQQGQPVPQVSFRLKRDPVYTFDAPPKYERIPNLLQTIRHRAGIRCAGLFAEDFIYPLTTPSLDDPSCDIMVHCYDESLDVLKARFRNSPYIEEIERLTASGPLSQANQPDRQQGEWWKGASNTRPLINLHETYFRVRVNPLDEKESWVFLLIDFKSRIGFYGDFLGNMRMKRPPFVLLRGVESVPGRAYGNGVYHKFYDKHLAIDIWFNRVSLKSSKTASMTFIHEGAIAEERDGQPLVIGGNYQWHIAKGMEDNFNEGKSPVWRKNLNEITDLEFQLIAQLIQRGELEFGITTAQDGGQEAASSAQLNGGTATAIRNIERTGNTIQRPTEDMMADDLKEVMEIVVDTILENMDPEEMKFTPDSEELATLNQEEIRALDRNVRILMTRARGEQAILLNQQAIDQALKYYQLPASMRKEVRSMFIAILKQLDVPDADDKLREPTEEEQATAEAVAKQNINVVPMAAER